MKAGYSRIQEVMASLENTKVKNFEKSLSQAMDFIKFLKENYEIDATICGGIARDIFFGLTPKDVDIVLYTKNPIKKKIDRIIQAYREVLSEDCEEELVWSIGSYPTYNGGRIKERIEHIWKIHELDFDVLLYNCSSPEEVMDHFDFNINQFIMDPVTREVTYYGTTDLNTLVEIRGDHEDARGLYIEEKHKNLIELAKEKGIQLPYPMKRKVLFGSPITESCDFIFQNTY